MEKTIDVENGNGRFSEAKEMAEEKLDLLQERLGAAARRIEELVRERPGAAILAALGAGFLFGRLARR